MSKNLNEKEEKFPLKKSIAYSLGPFISSIVSMTYILIYQYYFAVIGLGVIIISTVFFISEIVSWIILFGTPIIGILSDRTITKRGRRKPYIIASIVPICLITFLFWTIPPGLENITIIYLIILLSILKIVEPIFYLNTQCLFPEMFQNLNDRLSSNCVIQIFLFIGILINFIISILIDPNLFIYVGILLSIVITIISFIFVRFGIKERVEFSNKVKLSILKSIKSSFKNKTYLIFLVIILIFSYSYGLLSYITVYSCMPGEHDPFLINLLSIIPFFSATGFIFLWRYIALKIGIKKSLKISMIILSISLIPFIFIFDVITSIILSIFVGLGFSGFFLIMNPFLAASIDVDELSTGIRQEGTYYGFFILITRLSAFLYLSTIASASISFGTEIYDPSINVMIIIGYKILIITFSLIALIIGLIVISKFQYDKETYEQLEQAVEKLHKEKREKLKIQS